MNRFVKTGAAFLLGILGSVCPLAAQTANIGNITLSGPNFGYQTVGVYNLTGATQGCEQFAAQYNVCNGVNISTWQLTINFTANASGIAPSPLVFTSNGTNDQIPPTNSNFDPYSGQAANPWSLSFSLKNAGCSPACDATISSVTFSGTLDTTSLNLFNTSVSGPFILDSLPSANFSTTWNIPASDYTATPGALFDSTDILITNQPQLTSQTITFDPLADKVLTAAVQALNATASSNLAVTFTSNNTSACTVSGTAVTLVSAGICSITASQGGSATFAAATPVTQTFNVTQATQTITFGPLSSINLGDPAPALSATASSTLAVAFSSNTASVCTVSGTTITIVTGGTCSITATQPGNTIFAPAPSVTQTFVVNKTPQTISFLPLNNVLLTAATVTASATATSSLTVALTSNSLPVCTVSGTTVTLVSAGTCSITADQPGNTTFAAAPAVTQTFNIQNTQTISFAPIGNIALDVIPPALSATASSTLAVSFASTTQGVCTVSGTTVTLVSSGTCSITATQPGTTLFAPAPPVIQSFTVLATQTITFAPIGNLALSATPPALTATASSGLTVSFGSNTTSICTVSGTTVTLLSMGTCSITATQAGDPTHAAAPPVTQIFNVLTAQTITFGPISNLSITATPPALTATASSTLAVTFTSNNLPVCTVSGTTVTLVTAGVCSITASQTGNGTFAPAAPVTQTFNVQSNQTITFGPIGNIGLSATPPALSATASSTLAVMFTSNTLPVCTVSGTTVTLVTIGTCSITASQSGDAMHAAATPVTQTFNVLGSQTITFNSPGAQNLGTAVTLTATASSTLAVSYISNSLPVCTVANSTVTLLATGTCSITANQAGDATHAAAPPVTVTFAVNLEPQAITFNAIAPQPLGIPVTLAATASSTLAIAYTSNSLSICTVANSTVTLVTTGTCSITASQPGNTTFAAATPVTQTFAVTLQSQTITFGPVSTQTIGGSAPLTLPATASSTLAVSYTSNSTAVCTVTTAGAVSLVAPGTCSITATQAGNATFAAAAPVTQTFLVSTKTAQTITFSALSDQALGANPPALSATATSSLQVSFTSNSTSVCTVSGTTVTLAAIGVCSITASQPGDPTFAAATPITQTFNVRTTQTITFGPIGNIAVTATTPALSATATSGLAVAFASTTPGVCTVSGTAVTLVSAGACSITASQAGDATHLAAIPVSQSFTVLATQTITFNGPGAQNLGTSPTVSATASSTLAVSFSSNSLSVCTVSGSTVTLLTTGTCSITANQAGNPTFAAAPPVTQTFIVNLEPQTITFNPIASQALGTSPTLSATASSTLGVSFASNSLSVCTVTGSTVTLLISGTCSITASQGGNPTFAVATPVTQTFSVVQQSQTITFNSPGAQFLGTSPTLIATATSGLGVAFTSNSLSICTVSGTTLTLVAAGTCSITASQSGSSTFAAAAPITQTFSVTVATCDINLDGTTNVADVQLVINEALGVIPATHDLNHDGVVNVADVQKVINAALGLGCVVP